MPPPNPGGTWTYFTLADLNYITGLTAGAQGILYATTGGGGAEDAGAIVSLSPPASAGAPWTVTTLHSFPMCPFNFSCAEPAGLYYDPSSEVLYGMTAIGGNSRAGSVYAFRPPAGYQVLHQFDGSDGADPTSLALWRGFVYGTTALDGSPARAGTAFALQP